MYTSKWLLLILFVISGMIGCSTSRGPDTPVFTVIPGKTGTYDYYQVFEPFRGGMDELEGVWLMGELDQELWELILYRDGMYSLRLMLGRKVFDAEVGEWKEEGMLRLYPNAVLMEDELHQWRPREMVILGNEKRIVLVPPRSERDFQQLGALDPLCFKMLKR
ncbi:hypothetical protein [Poriferisphaera sp. WC338]|uniref:hypothetical protein n=1 Tax=Poriferisphaera sp. WC338 TaxID=3425129 RepID=UPI003D813191